MTSNPTFGTPLIQPPHGSSAIPIVAPTEENQGQKEMKPKAPPSAPTTPSSKTRTCRNVIIHGYCKYEGKGCEFNHDLNSNVPSPVTSPESKSKLRITSPAFNPTGSLTAALMSNTSLAKNETQMSSYEPSNANFEMGAYDSNGPYYQHHTPGSNHYSAGITPSNSGVKSLSDNLGSMELDSGMSGNYSPSKLQYHLYTTPLPHVSNLPSNRKTIHSFFMSDNLREELQRKNEASIQYLNPQDSTLPAEVHVYHSLYPLDHPNQSKSTKVFGYPTSVYKAASSIDGKIYALRRIEGYRLTNEAAMSTIENWRKISHPNIVSVREAFTTKAFGDHSLVFVYDYHPCSTTLADKYLHNAILPSVRNSQNSDCITETELWSFIVQITSAIRTLHASGLAACILDPTKILLTGKNRIRLNCCGIYDMLSYASTRNTAHYQQEDLLQFGQLLACLACNSSNALSNLPKSIDFIARHYPPDVKNVILYLLSKPSTTKNIDDILGMMGPKILMELNRTHHYNDFLESELSSELENGRVARLMMKLGFINERPE
ncbi:PAB-dependent poly(A)-specific ribonuclease subunit 3, variant 2 [Basidiobolus ranarum]|uniref:PAB-dependent poly(A)-specific ribonuclease subunit 3, variant 2 n=1 Tax=Basidiobolus ranarum TaxID=34480 RepID=A0ABR2WKF4_9FUNG